MTVDPKPAPVAAAMMIVKITARIVETINAFIAKTSSSLSFEVSLVFPPQQL